MHVLNSAVPASVRRLEPLREVKARTSLSKSSIYRRLAAGDFPAPVRIGSSSRWVAEEIDRWIADQVAKRDAERGAA